MKKKERINNFDENGRVVAVGMHERGTGAIHVLEIDDDGSLKVIDQVFHAFILFP